MSRFYFLLLVKNYWIYGLFGHLLQLFHLIFGKTIILKTIKLKEIYFRFMKFCLINIKNIINKFDTENNKPPACKTSS